MMKHVSHAFLLAVLLSAANTHAQIPAPMPSANEAAETATTPSMGSPPSNGSAPTNAEVPAPRPATPTSTGTAPSAALGSSASVQVNSGAPSANPSGAATPLPLSPRLPDGVEPASVTSVHDSVVHDIGIGWYGTRRVPLYSATDKNDGISVPLVGIRYWTSRRLGLDIAVGTMTVSGTESQKLPNAEVTTPQPTATAAVAHFGMPIALYSEANHSFQLIPEVEFGYSGARQDPPSSTAGSTATPVAKNMGMLFQLGMRAGAEIHFGFMGLPRLSLDASIAAYLSYSACKAEVGSASSERSQLILATSQVNSPWDIFRSNLAARYYF